MTDLRVCVTGATRHVELSTAEDLADLYYSKEDIWCSLRLLCGIVYRENYYIVLDTVVSRSHWHAVWSAIVVIHNVVCLPVCLWRSVNWRPGSV